MRVAIGQGVAMDVEGEGRIGYLAFDVEGKGWAGGPNCRLGG